MSTPHTPAQPPHDPTAHPPHAPTEHPVPEAGTAPARSAPEAGAGPSLGPFPPESAGVVFNPVDRRYTAARLIVEGLSVLVALVVVIVVGVLWWKPTLWIGLPALLIWAVASTWVIIRQTKAIGYAERPTDLLVRHGIMFHTTSVVPYGRLQFVEVTSGPVERIFGLSGVKLHTASAATDATIPGLPRAEAERLRDALAARGETQLAGL